MSDIHCQLASAPPTSFVKVGALRRLWRQHPVLSLRELTTSDPNAATADVLVMPGDLADQISQEGMTEAWSLTQLIANTLNCTHVIPVIGNHDVDSHRHTKHADPFYFARNLDPGFPFATATQRDSFFSEGFCLVAIRPGIEFVVLNTVADHLDKESAKRGQFSIARIDALSDALRAAPTPAIRIAVLHHHPILHPSPVIGDEDVLETGQQLVDVLSAARCGLIIHGHKHHPRLQIADGGAGALPVLAAGSVGALLGTLQGLTKNTFHLIEIEGSPVGLLPCRGHVRTWHWHLGSGWRPASEDAVDFPPRAGFGHRRGLDEIVHLLAGHFQATGKSLLHEKALITAVDDLLHLTPTELAHVRTELRTKFSLDLGFTRLGAFELGELEDAL